MTVYLDSSVALRQLLRQQNRLATWGKWTQVYTSDLLRVEVMRAVDRLRLGSLINDDQRVEIVSQIDQMCDGIAMVSLTSKIIDRSCQSFPTVIGTLDALHLSTALLLREINHLELTFLTHDRQLGLAAKSMGFPVEGL